MNLLWCIAVRIFFVCIAFLVTNIPAEANDIRGDFLRLRQAIEDMLERFPEDYPEGKNFLEQLDSLEKQSHNNLAQRKRLDTLRREVFLRSPLLKHQQLLFVIRPQYAYDHHNTETLFQVGEINERLFEGGSALCLWDVSTGAVKTLLDVPEGIVRDPCVHFDGERILFSLRRNPADAYHIYEIRADGSQLRQLTFAQGVSDIDPLYLPSDDIVFSSTREPKYCMCNRHIMCNLFRMSSKGTNIRQIGKSTLFEGHGTLMPDGRILYYRWEYVDRNFGDAQGLWTTYPDGSYHAVYWGNNTQSPGAVINPQPVPETSQVLCVFSSCHDRPWGALALIDRRLGVDGAQDGTRSQSVVRTWPPDAIHRVGEGDPKIFHWDTFIFVEPKYEDPYPLDKHYFLCARTLNDGEQTGLFLVDMFGNEVLLYALADPSTKQGCYDPMLLKSTPRPPVLPDRFDPHAEKGYFYVANVYDGTHRKEVPKGTIKYLRIIESPEKRNWTYPAWNGQGQQAPAMAWHDFNNKRILGTVPVEEDGSVFFEAPARTFMYFQLLDEKGMMVQSMRSGTIIQPGEIQGCAGCHESRLSAPQGGSDTSLMALKRPASPLTGWYGPPRLFDYMREVQPVFDRYCVRCHDYNKEAGQVLNLAADRDLVFNASYIELWRKGMINVIGAGPAQIQEAYSWGSHASKLTQFVVEPHYDVLLDQESRDRVITWIDINAPYYADYDAAYPDNPAGRSPMTAEEIGRLATLTGIPIMDQLGYDGYRGPYVSFDRPELSPCLIGLDKQHQTNYVEALEIIKGVVQRLTTVPREDMEGFIPSPSHRARQVRYALRAHIEALNLEAIRCNRHYDDSP